jgi:hypothetical protein
MPDHIHYKKLEIEEHSCIPPQLSAECQPSVQYALRPPAHHLLHPAIIYKPVKLTYIVPKLHEENVKEKVALQVYIKCTSV